MPAFTGARRALMMGASLLAGVPIATEVLPAVPSYALASTSYNFGSANVLESTDHKGIKLPSGASALPAVTDDWFQSWFFTIDEMASAPGSSFALASKGNSGHSLSGSNQFGLGVRGGYPDSTIAPYSMIVNATNSGLRYFNPSAVRTPSGEPGITYLLVIGQKGSFPFSAFVRVDHDGIVDPAIFDVQVGTANDGGSSWKYTNSAGTTPAWSGAGVYDLISGFGGNVDVADGANRRNALGKVANYSNVWGSFPFVNGAPDPAVLLAIANGAFDGKTLADLVGGTLRYANEFRGPNDLNPDPRGAVTAAAFEIGLNSNVVTVQGSPLRQPPELRLDTYGDRFVFPMKGTAKTGDVTFKGSFLGKAVPNSFEARLVRVDNGATLVNWTTLDATIDATKKRYRAILPNVPAGVTFRREVRWRNSPTISVKDGDRQGVGLVIFDVGQSQLAYQGYATNDPVGGGGGANVAPVQTENVFLTAVKQPYALNGQNFGGGKLGNVAVFSPYKAGLYGDGNTYTFETVKRLMGVPVMIVDLAIPGNHPNRLSYDRKPFAFTGITSVQPNAPNGSTTTFTTVNPACSTILGEGATVAQIPPGVTPGTLNINLFGVPITDDGNGNLVSPGITGGTINYANGVMSNIVFASAPAAGGTLTGTFTLFCTAPENSNGAQTPQNGQWSAWGDDTLPLDFTNRTGRTVRHLTRMRGIAPSVYRLSWYTSFDSPAGRDAVASLLDKVKARYDAAYPAGANSLWGFAMPTRVTVAGSTTDEGQWKVMGVTQRAYAATKPYMRVIGEFPDMELASNEGPHQSPLIGTKTYGERMGVGMCAMFTTNLSVEGPVLQSAKFTDANRNVIKLTFTLPNGTGLTTADGSTTGIAGIRVAPAANNNYTSLGFTAAITGANEVTLTKTSGSWEQGSKIGVHNGSPIMTGKANESVDNATLLKLLSDNDNSFGAETKYSISGRRGNPARLADGIVVADAA